MIVIHMAIWEWFPDPIPIIPVTESDVKSSEFI